MLIIIINNKNKNARQICLLFERAVCLEEILGLSLICVTHYLADLDSALIPPHQNL